MKITFNIQRLADLKTGVSVRYRSKNEIIRTGTIIDDRGAGYRVDSSEDVIYATSIIEILKSSGGAPKSDSTASDTKPAINALKANSSIIDSTPPPFNDICTVRENLAALVDPIASRDKSVFMAELSGYAGLAAAKEILQSWDCALRDDPEGEIVGNLVSDVDRTIEALTAFRARAVTILPQRFCTDLATKHHKQPGEKPSISRLRGGVLALHTEDSDMTFVIPPDVTDEREFLLKMARLDRIEADRLSEQAEQISKRARLVEIAADLFVAMAVRVTSPLR